MADPGQADRVAQQHRDRRRSPRGDEFDVVGRAGPIELQGAPYVHAEAREDLLVIKNGAIFVCARPDGEIVPGLVTGEGVYTSDTRFLSELRVLIGGVAPVLLSSSAESGYAALIDSTNAELRRDGEVVFPQQALNLERCMVVGDRVYVRLTLRNYGIRSIDTDLEIGLGADFADMFEVRGHPQRIHRGQALAPKRTSAGIALAYVGEDDQFRETAVTLDPHPARADLSEQRISLAWPVKLEPGTAMRVLVSVEPRSADGPRRGSRGLERAAATAREEQLAFQASCTRIDTDSDLFARIVGASLRDLHALRTPLGDGHGTTGEAIAAGIPWFVALFGRDSLITCQESLIVNPELARKTLRLLARFQATVDDPWRDAEPGKILHELRSGELARAGLIPHTPYYGTVDATPLFVVLAASYFRWTGDLETLAELRPALDAALRWIDDHGDLDGDGFVEYERRSRAGLLNQGWKDSEDCIVHADGSLAEGPIALVEVQGYVYMAKQQVAEVYAALGDTERAEALRREALQLKKAFNEAFWDPDEGMLALALDGRKRQVRSVTSNPGHALYCGIADAGKAALVAERLMAPDMFCGWGVRTLSGDSPAFNPMSYHNGSVWPHDNAIVAAGMKRYGFSGHVERIATALFQVAARMRDYRLPELYCGFDREERSMPVAYPVACSPQAWAAAAPFMLLQAMLGISAQADAKALTVTEPRLPGWLGRVHLDNLLVKRSRVSIAFHRELETTTFSVPEQKGEVRVLLEE